MPKNILRNNFRGMNTKCGLILIFLGAAALLTSSQTSSGYVFDTETGQPVEEALVFAYGHEILSHGPRQQLDITSTEGIAKISVQGSLSLWVGKQGYYPFYYYTYTRGFFPIITGGKFPPATIYLHKVKDGSFEEAMKARNHAGIIFYHNNPPRQKDLLKILQYSHWVYMNTAFYDTNSYRSILENFFKEYSFKIKQ